MSGYQRLEGAEEDALVSEQPRSGRRNVVVVLVSIAILVTILGLGFGLPRREVDEAEEVLPPVESGEPSAVPTVGKFPQAAVASDGLPCAGVGRDILAEGGTAVDAAVAALLCDGLYNPQSMGLGGGFLMIVYSKDTGQVEVLNARETAPLFSHPAMYAADPSLSSSGALSVGVPGEVAGYWAARRRYGNSSISWQRVLQPSIDMAKKGTPVSPTLASSIKDKQWKDPTLAETFTNPETGRAWLAGDLYRRPRLAATLETLAEAGDDGDALFYRGALGEALVEDLQELGGKMVMEDLTNYSPVWQSPLSVPLCRCGTAPQSTPCAGTT